MKFSEVGDLCSLVGLHTKTNKKNICKELAKIGNKTRTINNITRYDTKQQLPLFLIELEPKGNKEIFDIKKILNTIVTIEPPRYKKDILQCKRFQQYRHTKNYCNRNPECVKYAENHLTTNCPYTKKINEVKYYNCKGNYSASYKGCKIRQQRKLFPSFQSRTSPTTRNCRTKQHQMYRTYRTLNIDTSTPLVAEVMHK